MGETLKEIRARLKAKIDKARKEVGNKPKNLNDMICNLCNEDLGEGLGIFWQLKHLNECPENKPILYSDKITLKDIKEAFEYWTEKPQVYQGTTICGMIWRSKERQVIATCERVDCKPCREFDKLLAKEYNLKT
jgi:hypothetical protein